MKQIVTTNVSFFSPELVKISRNNLNSQHIVALIWNLMKEKKKQQKGLQHKMCILYCKYKMKLSCEYLI